MLFRVEVSRTDKPEGIITKTITVEHFCSPALRAYYPDGEERDGRWYWKRDEERLYLEVGTIEQLAELIRHYGSVLIDQSYEDAAYQTNDPAEFEMDLGHRCG